MNWRKRYRNILFIGAIIKGTNADIKGLIMEVIGFDERKYPILKVLENKDSKFTNISILPYLKDFRIGGIVKIF